MFSLIFRDITDKNEIFKRDVGYSYRPMVKQINVLDAHNTYNTKSCNRDFPHRPLSIKM